MKNLNDSFKDYIAVETLEGDNQYMAEGLGMQDARKGVIFESFPDVVHLQLKRFEYDIQKDAMVKVPSLPYFIKYSLINHPRSTIATSFLSRSTSSPSWLKMPTVPNLTSTTFMVCSSILVISTVATILHSSNPTAKPGG